MKYNFVIRNKMDILSFLPPLAVRRGETARPAMVRWLFGSPA